MFVCGPADPAFVCPASLRLSGTAKHGSRFAVGLAMHQDWATLTCLLQLLTLRMHAMDAHGMGWGERRRITRWLFVGSQRGYQ